MPATVSPLPVAAVRAELGRQGYSEADWELKPAPFDTERAPAGAFDRVGVYRIWAAERDPRRDADVSPWRPVLVVGAEVTVGPSLELLARFVHALGYFAAPGAFEPLVLMQIHRFALDSRDGFGLVEETVEKPTDELVVRGRAGRGVGGEVARYTFVTRVVRGAKAAAFAVTPLTPNDD